MLHTNLKSRLVYNLLKKTLHGGQMSNTDRNAMNSNLEMTDFFNTVNIPAKIKQMVICN